MKSVFSAKRLIALALSVLMLISVIPACVFAGSAAFYLCTPTSLNAYYCAETETVTYMGTYTGVIQDTRTYMFSLNYPRGVISISNVEGADITKDGSKFSYSFHLAKSVMDECAKPWTVTLSCTTASIVAPTTATVEFAAPPEAAAEYTVSFVDWDGTVVDTQLVEHGQSATAPASPVREGYTFAGWDTEFANITSDLTVTALYDINFYTVTFTDGRGTVIDTQRIAHGESATAPSVPAIEGLGFLGWDMDYTCITADAVINALWDTIKCTVSFYAANGIVLDAAAIEVDYGTSFADLSLPQVEPHSEYVFIGWDVPTGTVKTDTVITALFERRGDVNGDGFVDSLDAAMILRYDCLLISFDDKQLTCADFNGDGLVDSLDASLVLRYDAGILVL